MDDVRKLSNFHIILIHKIDGLNMMTYILLIMMKRTISEHAYKKES
jgi:hypothetical protein